MYACYLCNTSFSYISQLRVHLQRHKDNGQLCIPIYCRQENCKSSFTVLFNFLRHLISYHQKNTDVNREVVLFEGETQVDILCNSTVSSALCANHLIDGSTSSLNPVSSVNSLDFLIDVKTEGASLVTQLRANSSIPYGIIPTIIQSYNNMTRSFSGYFKEELNSSLLLAGVDCAIIDQVSRNMESKLELCKNSLDFLSTRYRIDSYFAGHPLMVQPEVIYYMPRLESHCGRTDFVYDQFQYVSVKKTLFTLFQNNSYVEAFLLNKCRPRVLSDFSDGSRFREHYLFNDVSKTSIMLQLFYDGLGVTNPLRSQGSVHNIGVFYYTIKNLSPVFNSCFGNVYLFAMGYTRDIAIYGYGPILEKFVSEIKELSTLGLNGIYPVLGNHTIYASLCQVTCDNLALNSLFGFIESFSASYFCTICYATKDDIQTKFEEELFEKRTVDSHKTDLANLKASRLSNESNTAKSKIHFRGVKTECPLNKIKGFHVTDNWCLDIMHTLLEGVVLVELGCIFHGLCVLDKCLTLSEINKAICLFWGKITVEKNHKPVQILKIHEPGHVLAPSMKAV
ncbi:uncharacterized protein LOC136083705 [Hydra vulgaris]|uniref:Uncharacterized protein LOC136083705 n=1 Tax=Hydra vulgaris TaxID=6087 RepID=A0ABM4CCK0_HYDVU